VHGGLGRKLLTGLLGFKILSHGGEVLLLALEELLLALGRTNVLNTDVKTLADKTVADLLVQLDTDGTPRDVPHAASATVIELVGHTLVDGTVNNDIDVIANLVGVEVGAKRGHAMLPEVLGELSTSASTSTERVRHLLLTHTKKK